MSSGNLMAAMAVAVLIPAAATAQVRATPAAPPSAHLSWVSCRTIAPATVQLIWRGVPWTVRYRVALVSAGRTLATDTISDTTYTRAALPAGDLRISVMPMVQGAQGLSATATVPVAGSGSARCGTN